MNPLRICVPVRHPDMVSSRRNELAIGENPDNHVHGLDALAMPERQFAALVTSKRWKPGKVLTVAFRGGRVVDRRAILAACKEWSRYANITFAQTSGPATIKVQFWDASNDPGSWSYLGTDALLTGPSEPTVNIGWPNDPGRDLHEIGHTLGLIHEHQNPLAHIPWNRVAVYSYYMGPPNYWSSSEIDQQVLANDTEPLTNGGYDRRSIMQYPIPVELVTDPKFAVGWNDALSPIDRAFIGRCYPPAGTGTDLETDPSSPKAPTMEELNRPIRDLIESLTASLDPNHPLDLHKLLEVLFGALANGGHNALLPAVRDNLDGLVSNPDAKRVLEAVIRAISNPTPENEIAAVLEVANSPLAKQILHVFLNAILGSLKTPQIA